MVNMSRLSNKVAIVTGASKGIGCGIATALGAAGARVAVARQPASVWRWPTLTESQLSFRKTEMLMRRALAMPGVRSGNTGPRRQRKIGKQSEKTFLR